MTGKPPLPESFKSRIQNLYGEEGSRWLINLPVLRKSLIERWSLELSDPVDQLSYNYLENAHHPDHGPVVLKIGFPNPELLTEIKALTLYRQAEGGVKLLDWDQDLGALLLERILPGHSLTALDDDQQATRIAAKAMINLRQPPPDENDFPTINEWCQGFSRYQQSFGNSGGPLPRTLFAHAQGLVKELLETPEQQYLLHGDLHHSNLLFREDGCWIVIDPKGVIGEFACEVGPYLFNPIPDLIKQSGLLNILSSRLDIMAEITGIARQRLAAWSFCRAVLASIWSVEEGVTDLGYWVGIAEVLNQQVD
jgi:streptomycin 6-kinase